MADINNVNVERIKVAQLYYVRAAVELGSFSQAATALGVTQPALSHGIAALERTLGGALFDRSTTGVAPTPLARRLLPQLHAALGSLEFMVAEARPDRDSHARQLRLGVSPIIHPDLVGKAVEAARSISIAIVVQEKDLAELRQELLARRLDLLLVPAVPDAADTRRREVSSEPLHYLPAHSDGSEEPIELGEISDHSVVMVGDACGLSTLTRQLFSSAGTHLAPYPGLADSYRSLEDWANLGLGGAFLPLSRFDRGTRTRPVHRDGSSVTVHYEARWLATSQQAGVIEALLDRIVRQR